MKSLAVILVVFVVMATGYGAWCSAESMKGVDRIYEEVQRKKVETEGMLMQSKRTAWKSKKHNGVDLPGLIDIEIITPRNTGETDAAWQARHDASVAHALTVNPPA